MGGRRTPLYRSTNWAIQTSLQGGAGAGVVISAMLFYLLDVDSQIYYPGRFLAVSLGAGAGIRGLSTGGLSWTFFRTAKPLWHHDFETMVTLASVEMTVVYGGSAAFVTFWRVDHDPYWIDIGGVTLGGPAGGQFSILASSHLMDDPRSTDTMITPS